MNPEGLKVLPRISQITSQSGLLMLKSKLLSSVHLPGKNSRVSFYLSHCEGVRCWGLAGSRAEAGWKENMRLSECKDNWFARVTIGGHPWQ